MRIEAMADKLSKYISKNLELSLMEEKKLYYEILLILLSLIKIICIFAVSILFECFVQCFLIVMVFSAFKTFTGGYHCNKYYKCLISGVVLFNVSAYLSKRIYLNSYNLLNIQISISLLFICLCLTYYPIENPIKPLKIEKTNIKKILVSLLVLYNVIYTVLFNYYPKYLAPYIAGFCLNIIFSLPLGNKLLLLIDSLSLK